MIVNTIACDVCGVQHTDTKSELGSRWYACKRANGGAYVVPLQLDKHMHGYIHLCGDLHMTQKILEMLQEARKECHQAADPQRE